MKKLHWGKRHFVILSFLLIFVYATQAFADKQSAAVLCAQQLEKGRIELVQQARDAEIEVKIKQQNDHFLDEQGNPKPALVNGLKVEFAGPYLVSIRNAWASHVEEIGRRWIQASSLAIQAKYQVIADQNSVKPVFVEAKEGILRIVRETEPGKTEVAHETMLLESFPEETQATLENQYQAKLKEWKQRVKSQPDLQQPVKGKILLRELKDIEMQVAKKAILTLVKQVMSHILNHDIKQVEKFLARNYANPGIEWESGFKQELSQMEAQLLEELAKRFPSFASYYQPIDLVQLPDVQIRRSVIEALRSVQSTFSTFIKDFIQRWYLAAGIKKDKQDAKSEQETRFQAFRKQAIDKFTNLSADLMRKVERKIQEEPNADFSQWFEFMLLEVMKPLQTQFPAEQQAIEAQGLAEYMLAVTELRMPEGSKYVLPNKFGTNKNRVELVLESEKARAYYEPELGTVVLEPLNGSRVNGVAPTIVLYHGAGTNKSNVASWKTLIQTFVNLGFNVHAIDLPAAGLGMGLSGVDDTTDYIDYHLRWVRRNLVKADEPLMILGRSMGAVKSNVHSKLKGLNAVVTAYVNMSFSNPRTIHLQTQNVLRQQDEGIVDGVVKEALDEANRFSEGYAKALDRTYEKQPTTFILDSLFELFLQGNFDEDGGRTVVDDLTKFNGKFSPLSHVYLFKSPLLGAHITWDEVGNGKPLPAAIWDEDEATHFLASARSNLTKVQWRSLVHGWMQRDEVRANPAFFSKLEKLLEIPEEELPKLTDQTRESVGAVWGLLDFIADLHSNIPAVEARARLLRAHRARFTGGVSYLAWYFECLASQDKRAQSELSSSAIDVAEPGRRNLSERAKRLRVFYEERRESVRSFLEKHQLLKETVVRPLEGAMAK